MITRVEGHLESIDAATATIRLPGGVSLSVLLPSYAGARLGGSIGQATVLHTWCFFEAPSQGSTILPRLAGFLTREDRGFFELFIGVKGVGARKALRAMALPTPQLAAAIADRDVSTLQSLPEIGKRTAETIVVSLKDKVEPYLPSRATTGQAGAATGAVDEPAEDEPAGDLARESLAVLLQLGENRVEALTLIDRVLSGDDPPRIAADVVSAVYRLKR